MSNRPENHIELMLRHAATAGALRVKAREIPEAARGLLKCADLHSRRVRDLADNICTRQSPGGS